MPNLSNINGTQAQVANIVYFYFQIIPNCGILYQTKKDHHMQDVLKKLKFKDKAVILNAPADIAKEIGEPRFATSFDKKVKSFNTLVFVNNKQELLNFLNKQLKNIEPDSVLWFAYPKGTSKIKTDINRDSIRTLGEEFNMTTVTAISIDDTWSALRFRPVDKVGK